MPSMPSYRHHLLLRLRERMAKTKVSSVFFWPLLGKEAGNILTDARCRTAEDLTATSRRLARYESLLNDIMPMVSPEVRALIDEARENVSLSHDVVRRIRSSWLTIIRTRRMDQKRTRTTMVLVLRGWTGPWQEPLVVASSYHCLFPVLTCRWRHDRRRPRALLSLPGRQRRCPRRVRKRLSGSHLTLIS